MFSRACTYTCMIVQWLVGFPEVTGFKMLTTFFLDIILFLDGIPCMENHQACASEVGMRSIQKQEQIRRTHDFLMGNVNHLSVTGQILWAPQKTCTISGLFHCPIEPTHVHREKQPMSKSVSNKRLRTTFGYIL